MTSYVGLPEEWVVKPLGEVAQLAKDKVDPSTDPDACYVGLEHVEAHTMRLLGYGRGSDVKSAKTKFAAGDVLYGKLRPYLNKVARPPFGGISSTDFLVFTESPELDRGYLAQFLNQLSVAGYAHHVSAGVSLPRADWKSLSTLPIAFPPSKAEQRAIVGQIERARSLLWSANGHITQARRATNRFQRAVLTAASAGRLTAAWRSSHGVIDEMESPGRWLRTTVGDIAECLDQRRKPINATERAKRPGNIPYYGANGQVGWIDEPIFDEPLVLVVEDETFTGRTKPFSYVVTGPAWVNNHAHVLRAKADVSTEMLNIVLSYYDFIPLTSGTTGRRKLNKSALMSAPLLLPPREEQEEIVCQVNKQLTQAVSLIQRLDAASTRVDRSSQAVLAKAFRGELIGASADAPSLPSAVAD